MDDRLKKLSKKDLYLFFEKLLEKCKKNYVYSVIETVTEMGIPYETVTEWASSNEDWQVHLEICRYHCACNAQEGWRSGILSEAQGIKYCAENDDDFDEANREYEEMEKLRRARKI